MSFFIIVAIIIGIFIIKFVYDTYFSDNTEKRFESYRQQNAIEAAKIEKPKNIEQFVDLYVTTKENEKFVPEPSQIISNSLPNLFIYLESIKSTAEGMKKSKETVEGISYNLPILTYGKRVATILYVIIYEEGRFSIKMSAFSDNGMVSTNKIKIIGDVSVEKYEAIFNALSTELMSKEIFNEIIQG